MTPTISSCSPSSSVVVPTANNRLEPKIKLDSVFNRAMCVPERQGIPNAKALLVDAHKAAIAKLDVNFNHQVFPLLNKIASIGILLDDYPVIESLFCHLKFLLHSARTIYSEFLQNEWRYYFEKAAATIFICSGCTLQAPEAIKSQLIWVQEELTKVKDQIKTQFETTDHVVISRKLILINETIFVTKLIHYCLADNELTMILARPFNAFLMHSNTSYTHALENITHTIHVLLVQMYNEVNSPIIFLENAEHIKCKVRIIQELLEPILCKYSEVRKSPSTFDTIASFGEHFELLPLQIEKLNAEIGNGTYETKLAYKQACQLQTLFCKWKLFFNFTYYPPPKNAYQNALRILDSISNVTIQLLIERKIVRELQKIKEFELLCISIDKIIEQFLKRVNSEFIKTLKLRLNLLLVQSNDPKIHFKVAEEMDFLIQSFLALSSACKFENLEKTLSRELNEQDSWLILELFLWLNDVINWKQLSLRNCFVEFLQPERKIEQKAKPRRNTPPTSQQRRRKNKEKKRKENKQKELAATRSSSFSKATEENAEPLNESTVLETATQEALLPPASPKEQLKEEPLNEGVITEATTSEVASSSSQPLNILLQSVRSGRNRKQRNVVEILKEYGFIWDHTAGSHAMYKHKTQAGPPIPVPTHGTLDLGTARSIMKLLWEYTHESA